MNTSELLHRRSFLRRLTGAALGVSATNVLTDLRLIQNAAAQSIGTPQFSDYKALVCLFLNGGNDASNLLLPSTPEEYTSYATARTNMALADSAANATVANPYYIIPLSTANTPGRVFGTHSSCPEIQSLFDSGKLAFLTNVGSLVEPMTKAQYSAGTRRKPPQLFSHNDQVVQWQTSIPDQISPTGWGGRMADVLRGSAWGGTGNRLSLSISASGFNTWQVGDLEHLYQVPKAGTGATGGAPAPSAFSTFAARSAKINEIVAQGKSSANLFERDYSNVFASALDSSTQLNNALAGISSGDAAIINGYFDPLLADANSNVKSVAGQMKMVARMIAARGAMGLQRQIFFCSLGGFDTHGGQITSHGPLLQGVSKNIKAFYDCINALSLGQKVTTFTASDFGRTFTSNGYGSDHGWGTHTMIVGGAVQGGRLYGTFPTLQVNGPDDSGLGRWIPTTSVDQYAATLARWFGVTEANLDLILPNLNRFASRNLGFMA